MEDQVSSRLVVANDDILMILVVIVHSSAGDARMGGEGGHFGRGQMEQEWRTGDGLTMEDAILSPRSHMACSFGPMNMIPFFPRTSGSLGFSEACPHPAQTAEI